MTHRLDPHRLVLARQLHGLTQAALAACLGVRQPYISVLESGTDHPTPQMLRRMSEALDCPIEFLAPFEGHETALAEHQSEVFFRSLKSTPRTNRLRAQGMCGALELVASMIEEMGATMPRVRLPLARGHDLDEQELPETDDNFLPTNNKDFNGLLDGINPPRHAYLTRQAWGLGDDPLPSVLSTMEAHGVIATIVPDMDADTIDAFSYWKGARPVVALNHNKQDPYRSRFDAAHELGHLLMHRGLPSMIREDTRRAPRAPADKIENQAHAFAAEFIVPATRWVAEAPRSINPYAYLPHKARWGLSVKALIVRSHRTGILNKKQYTAALKRYSSLGWNRGEPRSDVIEHEKPTLLQGTIARAAERNRRSTRSYLHALHLPPIIIDLVLPTSEPSKVISLAARRDRETSALDDPEVQCALSDTIAPVYDPEALPLDAPKARASRKKATSKRKPSGKVLSLFPPGT